MATSGKAAYSIPHPEKADTKEENPVGSEETMRLRSLALVALTLAASGTALAQAFADITKPSDGNGDLDTLTPPTDAQKAQGTLVVVHLTGIDAPFAVTTDTKVLVEYGKVVQEGKIDDVGTGYHASVWKRLGTTDTPPPLSTIIIYKPDAPLPLHPPPPLPTHP
jgi:hypothetical protein